MHLAYLTVGAAPRRWQAHRADEVESDDATNSSPCSHVRLARSRGQPPDGGQPHEEIRESLRKLWRKVGPCLPPPSRPALLPQSLQGQLPCENGEGPCVHATVVRLLAAQGFVGVGRDRRKRWCPPLTLALFIRRNAFRAGAMRFAYCVPTGLCRHPRA